MDAEYIGAYLEITQGTFPDLPGAYTILKMCYRPHWQGNPTHHGWIWRRSPGTKLHFISGRDPSPPERTVPTHVYPLQIDNGVLTEAELEAAVRWLRMDRAGDNSNLRANHFKTWRRENYPEK